MKTSGIIAIAGATFLGALAAIEVDHALNHRRSALGDSAVPNVLRATNVDYQPVTSGPADFRAAAKKVLPSVVSIDRFERVAHFFSEDSTVEETSTGSGVIISRDGVIVTNNHVVENATEVHVHLPDHRTVNAEVIGTDRTSDIAVIRVKADNLSPVELGDSDKVDVGQWVMAVGNPLGFDQTLSVGVISNKARSLGTPGGVLLNALQTDAPINPGNSGGALTDADGRLIGINAAISSNTGTNIGLGFAIPVNRVRRVTREIIQTGRAQNPYFGFFPNERFDGFLGSADGRQQVAQAVNADNVPSQGLLIPPNRRSYSITPNSPAARAGLQPLDVILSIDGAPVTDRLEYFAALDGKHPGDRITVKFWSRGKTQTATITLTEEPLSS